MDNVLSHLREEIKDLGKAQKLVEWFVRKKLEERTSTGALGDKFINVCTSFNS